MDQIPQECRIRNAVELPLKGHNTTFFTFHGLIDNKEHIAIGLGDFTHPRPLVRVHSECLTGDVFGSGRCDCGDQLDEAVEKIAKEGGFLLYLRQEGRGIGLYNKIDTYELQLEGVDTFRANQLLNFESDLRNYEVAAQMLSALNVFDIELLSNNPDKEKQLKKFGIQVSKRNSTGVFLKSTNSSYLAAKVMKTGHFINLPELSQEHKNAAP